MQEVSGQQVEVDVSVVAKMGTSPALAPTRRQQDQLP
jgi:hypothetical protein